MRIPGLTRLFVLFALVGIGAVVPGRATAQTSAPTLTEVKDLPLTAAERQVYVGNYSVRIPDGNRVRFRFYEEDGQLKGQPETDEPKRLLYQGENVFRPEETDLVLTFTVEDGRATKFTFRMREQTLEGTREP